MAIKANIPSQAVGRLLDALTDAIRPFTEERGLRADEIRLQREDVLLEIAKKARSRLAIERAEPGPVANKFLVPFLEKASLEEGASSLTDWWAALLVTASKHSSAQKLIYIDILSKIGGEDAQFLERLWNAKTGSAGSWLIGSEVPSRLELSAKILEQGNFEKVEAWVETTRHMLTAQQRSWASRGCIAEYLSHPTGSGRKCLSFPIAEPVDASIALGLLVRSHLSLNIPTPWIGAFDVSGQFLMLSKLGDSFLAACHGQLHPTPS